MGVPTSEVGYTIATTRRETTEVHKKEKTFLPSMRCISNRHYTPKSALSDTNSFRSLLYSLCDALYQLYACSNNGRIPYNPRHLCLRRCCDNCLPPHIPQNCTECRPKLSVTILTVPLTTLFHLSRSFRRRQPGSLAPTDHIHNSFGRVIRRT